MYVYVLVFVQAMLLSEGVSNQMASQAVLRGVLPSSYNNSSRAYLSPKGGHIQSHVAGHGHGQGHTPGGGGVQGPGSSTAYLAGGGLGGGGGVGGSRAVLMNKVTTRLALLSKLPSQAMVGFATGMHAR